MTRGLVRDIRLEPGDTVLIGGLPEDTERLRQSRELLLLEQSAGEVPLRAYAPRAIAIFACVIIAASTGLMPIVTAVLTNVLSNNATAVLFTPIAIGIAQKLNVPPEAFIMCIIFAANCSFATPVGYQTNLLVLGPGRYRFSDYLKAGIPLIILIWVVFSFAAPIYYGL